MEPEIPPAVMEYLYVGQGAEDLCARGVKAVVKEVRGTDRWRSEAHQPHVKTFSSGHVSYSITERGHPAHTAVWISLDDARGGHLYAACGYGDEAAFRTVVAGLGAPEADVRRHALGVRP
jgi:hypothetical protein